MVFRPWYEAVPAWAIAPIDPNWMCRTPRPQGFVTGQIATEMGTDY